MEAPKCKICHLHHYGMCVAVGDVPAKVIDAAEKAAQILQGARRRSKKKSSSVVNKPADGEAGAGVRPAPAEPLVRLGNVAEPGSIMAAAQMNALLYNPDGTINEDAARAGHNAYMKLAMRKYRARKGTERSGG